MKMISITLAAMALFSAASTAAEQAPVRYDLKLKLSRADTVIANPRLIAKSGEPASFLTDDGKGMRWSAILSASPDAARPGQIALDIVIVVSETQQNGTITTRRVTTTLSMNDPGHAGMDMPATPDKADPVHIDLDVATAPATL